MAQVVRQDDTRQRLLEAAGEVFAEKGFETATVREICSKAGANLAAVNYYFGDKHHLYIEVVRYAHRDWGAKIAAVTASSLSEPSERLEDYIQGFVARLFDDCSPPWRARLMMREMAEPTPGCLVMLADYVRPLDDYLQAILEELLPEASSGERRMVAYSIVGQCLFYKVHRPMIELISGEEEYRTLEPARLAEHITRFTLAALGRGRPLGTDANGQGKGHVERRIVAARTNHGNGQS